MTHCPHPDVFFSVRKARRERMLRKMANMRAAKERKRLATLPADEPPKLARWYRFEFGVRDKLNGETHFTDLHSIRHAAKAISLILKFYT